MNVNFVKSLLIDHNHTSNSCCTFVFMLNMDGVQDKVAFLWYQRG